jgi:hypothetical protein
MGLWSQWIVFILILPYAIHFQARHLGPNLDQEK